MSKEYEVDGPVQKLEQRSTSQSMTGLEDLIDVDSFDVEFSREGKPTKLTRYTFASDVSEVEHYVYDDKARLVLILRFDTSGSLVASTENHYDEGGRRIGWTERGVFGEVKGRCTETYIEGLLVSSVTSDVDGVPVIERDFEYKGNVLWKSIGRHFDRRGNPREQWVSFFDSEERVIETYRLTAEGEPAGDSRYKFQFDEHGRELSTWSFNEWANDVPETFARFEYTLDEFGNWIERRKFHRVQSDSEWSVAVTTRKFTYYQKE